MEKTGNRGPQDMRIDSRILKHLLHEATDLLEECQTHTLVEKHSEMTAHVLAQANWRMTATCSWVISELLPTAGEGGQAARLHAPSPIFSRDDGAISPQLAVFALRVDRLHERARRLDDLARGPMVSTKTQGARPVAEPDVERQSASIIPLFANPGPESSEHDPVGDVLTSLRHAIAARE